MSIGDEVGKPCSRSKPRTFLVPGAPLLPSPSLHPLPKEPSFLLLSPAIRFAWSWNSCWWNHAICSLLSAWLLPLNIISVRVIHCIVVCVLEVLFYCWIVVYCGTIPQLIHPPDDRCLSCYEHSCTSLLVDIWTPFSWAFPGMESLAHRVGVSSTSVASVKRLSRSWQILTSTSRI